MKVQLPELERLSHRFLPEYEVSYAGSAEEVEQGAAFDLIISSFLPFLPALLSRVQQPGHLHFTGSGTDRLPELMQQADLSGVRITASAGVNAVSIAEHIAGCILTFAKNLHLYRDQQRQGIWKRFWHEEIRGQQVCIIGMGEVGRAAARRCKALEMEVTGCVRSLQGSRLAQAREYTSSLIAFEELLSRLSDFDYVVLCLPLTAENKGFADSRFFSCMKPGSVLINIARGGLLDEAALMAGLQHGQLKGAALDVFEEEPLGAEHPFWQIPNLLLTPHVAGTTQHYLRNMFETLARQLKA